MLICRTAFATADGITQVGTLVRDDDPRVETHSAAFESLESRVEQATARPGEVRAVEMPAKKVAAVKKTASKKG